MANSDTNLAGIERRSLLFAPLLAALPQLLATSAQASPLDPTKTIIVPPKDIVFRGRSTVPPQSVETADLFGHASDPGLYLVLTKWYPGWMSAPHYYDTDRICVVVSGTWWVTSGDDFDPASTVPVAPGGFVHRIAHTSHYDGVKADEKEPAVIAICGMGPVNYHSVDPTKPQARRV